MREATGAIVGFMAQEVFAKMEYEVSEATLPTLAALRAVRAASCLARARSKNRVEAWRIPASRVSGLFLGFWISM